MREIKFRIMLNGTYHYWGFIEQQGHLVFAGLPQNNHDTMTMEEARNRSQQYTGLHDKNGKEIWEGDILIDHKRKYICSWKKEETAFVIYGEDKYKNTTIGHRAGSGKWVQRYFVVIGNIYENPELIKVSQ
jgi:uncharacterized phage protein (TIGR01671 family)